ncbi:hypothetical protein MSAN_01954400 [Mycena sanguinolenta]|uniref:Uncharacterized protein n=1 Tax=Mycena sanguinolenta TaxID=230812 RepID=A0A8H7CQG4_9AGAR|nr:hypothetical protein MSAN_01954400 [Mycena sanguinolenta]
MELLRTQITVLDLRFLLVMLRLLGPNQLITVNNAIHGGTGGAGGESHYQAPGGQGGRGEAPTVIYNFPPEQTRGLAPSIILTLHSVLYAVLMCLLMC